MKNIFSLASIAGVALLAAFASTGFDSCKTTSPTSPTDSTAKHTADTTSHNYTWVIDTIGDETTTLSDIFALSDSDVWAVGYIHVINRVDGSSQDYGMAHWDGSQWTISDSFRHQLTAVYAFATNDIWVADAGPEHWDGFHWHAFDINGIGQGYGHRLWGTSSSDLYFAQEQGGLAHFAGSPSGGQWTPVMTATSCMISDVWGAGGYVWRCEASNDCMAGGIVEFKNGIWNTISKSSTSVGGALDSISPGVTTAWATSDTLYAIGGFPTKILGLYRLPLNSGDKRATYVSMQEIVEDTDVAKIEMIRGSASNNIFMVGDLGTVIHYNGSTFHRYNQMYGDPNILISSVSVLPKSVYMAGSIAGGLARGIVIRGKAF